MAEFLLLRAFEEQPENISAARRLALLYARQGRHRETVEFARRVVREEPGNVVHWHLMATALEGLGHHRVLGQDIELLDHGQGDVRL